MGPSARAQIQGAPSPRMTLRSAAAKRRRSASRQTRWAKGEGSRSSGPESSLKTRRILLLFRPCGLKTFARTAPSAAFIPTAWSPSSGRSGSARRLSSSPTRRRPARSPTSFDGDGALFRLVSEAQRIRLAHLLGPLLAVHRRWSTRCRTRSPASTRRCCRATRCASSWPTTRAPARLPRESACGPAAKAPDEPPALTGYAPAPRPATSRRRSRWKHAGLRWRARRSSSSESVAPHELPGRRSDLLTRVRAQGAPGSTTDGAASPSHRTSISRWQSSRTGRPLP